MIFNGTLFKKLKEAKKKPLAGISVFFVFYAVFFLQKKENHF